MTTEFPRLPAKASANCCIDRRSDGSAHSATYPEARARMQALEAFGLDEWEEMSGAAVDVSGACIMQLA
jgi:hypothetical protein